MNPLTPISMIADSVMSGLDDLFTSDEEREKAKFVMMRELNQPHIMQAMTNIKEADHPSTFVAGWRPALGWLCVLLLAYAWIVRDFILIGLALSGKPDAANILPEVDSGELLTLVFALLGLGATRTYEKVRGVARAGWKKAGVSGG